MAYHSDFLRQSPVVSHVDLRDMLRRYIIKQGLDLLKKSDLRREKVISGKFPFQRYKDEIVGFIKEFYGKLPVRNCSSLCKARFVSKFEKKGFRIENVLFDSFPGYPVNATVYIPSDFDPPFPAIVVPTGHSGKQFGSYQLPCQYFARAGYVAVSFDPPGQAGEKQEGNDHFIDGVRCYLVGHTSSRYFVVDALRCIDYLETRKDVDMSFGVAMTGVSGGGTTTMLSSLLDDRIVVQGPSCCAVKNEEINLMWTYANCPETHMYGRYELGIDDTDIIAAFAPRPAMLMAGRYDGLFRIESVRRMAHEIQKVYTAARASENFVFMEDDAPHDYTLNQARAFVGFLNKHFIKQFRPLPPIDSGEYVMIPYDELKCNPPLKSENMRTITVATALQIKKNRSKNKSTLKSIQPVIKKVVMAGKKKLPVLRFKAHEYFNFACWKTRQMLFFDNRGIELPAFYMVPSHNFTSTIVHFDDRDRYSDLVSAGKLTVVAGIYSNKKNCALLSVDLPGWGDTVPSMYPYELYGWGAPDRYISYISAANGDHVMAMRIRYACAVIIAMKKIEKNHRKIIVTGRGMGGVVALHAAAILNAHVSAVAIWDSLWDYLSLADARKYPWGADVFLPEILKYYDLPEILSCLKIPVRIFNPVSGDGNKITGVEKLNRKFSDNILVMNCDDRKIIEEICKLVY